MVFLWGKIIHHSTQKPEELLYRIILACTRPDDLILDPFLGSGTSLRVCQQLNRKAIGIEINPEFVDIALKRLNKPFVGFDSIDEKMKRVPNDLNDPKIRLEYIKNHIKWFLNNHPNAINEFLEDVKEKYKDKLLETGQYLLIDNMRYVDDSNYKLINKNTDQLTLF